MGRRRLAEVARPEAGDVVVKFKLLPKGPYFDLGKLMKAPAPVHFIRVGSGAHNDMVVHGSKVADTHCVLRVTRKGVEVSDFGHTGETLANRVAVTDGYVMLHANSVLELGRGGGTRLMACASDSERPEMVVQNLYQLVQESQGYFSDDAKAAQNLGIADSTFRQWLRTHKFKIAASLVAMLAVTGGAFLRESRNSKIPAVVSPAALAPQQRQAQPASRDAEIDSQSTETASDGPRIRQCIPPVRGRDTHLGNKNPNEPQAPRGVAARAGRRSSGHQQEARTPENSDVSDVSPVSAAMRADWETSVYRATGSAGLSVSVKREARGYSHIVRSVKGAEQ